MSTLVLLHYNNYYNRIVKKENSLNDYLQYQIGDYIQGVNFIPNDYITTTQIVNWTYEDPDYLLVINEDNEIVSRWFVIATNRLRSGQLELGLYRDLMVDYYDNIIEAPMFIEKATVDDNDPAVYNSENMTFNEILQSTETLEDNTHCPWLVGYIARNSSTFNNLSIDYESDLVPDYSVDTIDDLQFAQYLDKEYNNFSDVAIDTIFTAGNSVTFNSFNKYGEVNVPAGGTAFPIGKGFGYVTQGTADSAKQGYYNEMLSCLNRTAVTSAYDSKVLYANRYFAGYLKNAIPETTWETITNQVKEYTGSSIVNEISQYVNKIVKVGDDYYRVTLETTSTNTDYSAPIYGYNLPIIDQVVKDAYTRAYAGYLNDWPELAKKMSSEPINSPTTSNNFICTIRTSNSNKAKLVLTRITDIKFSAKLTTSANHVHLSDAPYDMFCMPYSDEFKIITRSGDAKLELTASKALALATMNSIAREGIGVSKVHDIQLLPYCPLQQFITIDGKLDLTQTSTLTTGTERYYFITDESGVSNIGVFIYCDKSSGELNISKSIPITDYKVQALCDKYRLCSPNYSSIFEFNAAYNRGVEYFNVDFNYKPYSPYIHVNPNFKKEGLYGEDQNDPRGLICSGDFSITLISDAWETYQLQNKNYQLSFQRQIENMEVNNAVQREREAWSIASSALGATTGGAIAGNIIGGGIGAGIGAVVGGTASLIGGLKDRQLNEKLRNEALDYTKDQFGYQLGNIKALPNTIAKVGTFNRNNKIFPVLEYYTCTPTEKQALKDKMKYNGMTVMRIGTLSEFMKPTITYIKGQLIRIDDIQEDFHIINGIANELYKGVFI